MALKLRSFYPLFCDSINRIKTLSPHFLNTLQNNGLFVPKKIGGMMNPKWEELVEKYFTAVLNDNIPKVEELLSPEAVSVDLRFPQYSYGTALHIGGRYGYYDLVRLLVDKYHAQVNNKDKEGIIPLEIAAQSYNIKIVKFLLQRNSECPDRENVEYCLNTEEVDELFEAAESNNIKKIAELITERGVDADSEDRGNWRRTILDVAATKGYYDLVKILVDTYGADIQHEDELGESAKHKASKNGHENIVSFLLERGFKEPSWISENLEEAKELFEAAESNDIKKIAELITERGVDVDYVDRGNWCRTILDVAATKGYYDLVKILVDTYGADIQHVDELGQSAKHRASKNGHENIVSFLLERGFKEPWMSWNHAIDRQDDIETLMNA